MCIKATRSKAGSVTVEAALLLPVVLICFMTFASLLKVLYIHETLFHEFAMNMRIAAMEAYAADARNIQGLLGFGAGFCAPAGAGGLEEVIRNCLDAHNYGRWVKDYRIIASGRSFDAGTPGKWYAAAVRYDLDINGPMDLVDAFQIEHRLRARIWSGIDPFGLPLAFEQMEHPSQSSIVYVFPRAGEKYHREDCRVLAADPKQELLSKGLRKKYAPCSLCGAASLEDGAIVYRFRTGTVYHTGSCPVVRRYTVAMDRSHAVAEGYLPCQICHPEH